MLMTRSILHVIAFAAAAGCGASSGRLAADANAGGGTTSNPSACIDTVVSGNNDLSHVRGGVITYNLRDAQEQLQIFTSKPDGSERRQLTTDGQNGLAAWSPDGRQLTFMAIRTNGPFIGVMNADGSNQQLFAADGISPDWSPDGRLIAFS